MGNVPNSTPLEDLSRDTFTALMWALSYPGRAYSLPDDMDEPYGSLVAIAHTLLDLETTYYTPDTDLEPHLARTSARSLAASEAAYHFYPALTPAHLDLIRQARTGTLLYPDHSATLIIGCQHSGGGQTAGAASETLRLTGPGIQTALTISVAGIPRQFWEIRQEMIHYPLGWDLYLVDKKAVIGLPRTTHVERL